jgi:8-oxo-dGTP diphosphatase
MYKIEITDFFNSAFSVDCVIFGYSKGEIKALLIQRGMEPYNHELAIPGDLVYPNEDLKEAAERILFELTGLTNINMRQAHAFGQPDRHPQGRVITIAYYALIKIEDFEVKASSWADNVMWIPLNEIPKLAFDHNLILDSTYELLKSKLTTEPVCFEMLPNCFTLLELQQLYEYAFNTSFDKANFRKKIKNIPLVELDLMQKNVNHRPAKLFKFDFETFEESSRELGYQFKV